MCPQAIGAVHRPKHLPDTLIERLQPALRSAKYVELHGIGEPLLSPAFWRFLTLLQENPACDAVVNTNLAVLTEKMLDDVSSSTLLQIGVSLDAATPETYWKIRGADFAVVTNNIRRLSARLHASSARRRPKLVLNMTVMKENLAEVPLFVPLAQVLGADQVAVWPINDFGPGDEQMNTWETDLRNWRFVYREQVVTAIPDCVAAVLNEARQVAGRIGMDFMDSNIAAASRSEDA
jgi:MoaA/NifB/PqqE/SkfB family radical SAM enzyme